MSLQALIAAGKAVEAARDAHPDRTLANLYRPEVMPADLRAAHMALDQETDRAFGAVGNKPTLAERQRLLFEGYQQLAAPLTAGMRRGRR